MAGLGLDRGTDPGAQGQGCRDHIRCTNTFLDTQTRSLSLGVLMKVGRISVKESLKGLVDHFRIKELKNRKGK